MRILVLAENSSQYSNFLKQGELLFGKPEKKWPQTTQYVSDIRGLYGHGYGRNLVVLLGEWYKNPEYDDKFIDYLRKFFSNDVFYFNLERTKI